MLTGAPCSIRDLPIAELRQAAREKLEIPVIEGPLRSADQTDDGRIDYGNVHIDAPHPPSAAARAYEEARDYLCYGKDKPEGAHARGLMHTLFLRAEDAEDPLTLEIGSRSYLFVPAFATPREAQGKLRVGWDPRRANMVDQDGGHSPAVTLAHELVHLYAFRANPTRFWLHRQIPVRGWESQEEQQTIIVENLIAAALHEGQRKDYSGDISYKVSGPTQHRPTGGIGTWFRQMRFSHSRSVIQLHSHLGVSDSHYVSAQVCRGGWPQFIDGQAKAVDALEAESNVAINAFYKKWAFFAVIALHAHFPIE